MRVLVFTTLYPNAAQPQHGIFIENRLRNLIAQAPEIDARVLAPVPWVPAALARGRYTSYVRAPVHEMRAGIAVDHPRYPVVPKIGMSLAPWLLYARARLALRTIVAREGDFDLIDAHYFYPDGVAAALLGRALGKPVVITARGSDLNVLPEYAAPRAMIRWAAGRAAGLVTVSAALKARLIDLGVAPARIEVLRNGVDLATFHPIDKASARARLGAPEVPARLIVSVGNLVPLKGHDLVIEALADLENAHLWIIGAGPEAARLEARAAALGLERRVRLVGRVDHEALAPYYAAADALVLASAREGWPNVLLEAMACATPVVATDVGGVREIVAPASGGIVVAERSASAVAQALKRLLAAPPDRARVRSYAEGFDWSATSAGLARLFRSVLAAPRGQEKLIARPYP